MLAGVDGAAKPERVNLLNEWMHPRWMTTRVFDEPADTERERPKFWRFWLALPARGRVGMSLSSWYSQPVLDFVYGRIDERAFDAETSEGGTDGANEQTFGAGAADEEPGDEGVGAGEGESSG